MLLFKQSEIIAVNTMIMRALVQHVHDGNKPKAEKPNPGLLLNFGGSPND